MDKHAYLIMAFNNFYILEKQLMMLDDERNDLYLHIDAKTENFDFEHFKNIPKKSKLYFADRKKMFWADYSQVDITLDLLDMASKNHKYKYYHMFSGVDLPIKTQDEIHSFFDSKDCEFLGIVPKVQSYSINRVKYYYNFTNNVHYKNCKPLKALDRLLAYAQRLIFINRLRGSDLKIIDGWDWCSITDDFARYLLKNRELIEKTFRKALCPIELYHHTMAYNSEFFDKIYCKNDLKKGTMRFIDWGRGKPYVFTSNDFDELVESEYMFARKFDEKVDVKIVDMLYEKLSGK